MIKKKNGDKYSYGKPIATTTQNRLPIFGISKKKTDITHFIYKNQYGELELKGRLNQKHQDLLDAIMAYGLEYQYGTQQELYIIIDPYQIQKHLKLTKHKGLDIIRNQLLDMIDTHMQIKAQKANGDTIEIYGTIVAFVKEEYKKIKGPGGAVKTRGLWLIALTPSWTEMFYSFIKLRYDHVLPTILQLRSMYSKAIARFFVSQNSMVISVDKLFEILNIRYKKRLVLEKIKNDIELLAKIGITIENSNFKYTKSNLVCFENPLKILSNKTLKLKE